MEKVKGTYHGFFWEKKQGEVGRFRCKGEKYRSDFDFQKCPYIGEQKEAPQRTCGSPFNMYIEISKLWCLLYVQVQYGQFTSGGFAGIRRNRPEIDRHDSMK